MRKSSSRSSDNETIPSGAFLKELRGTLTMKKNGTNVYSEIAMLMNRDYAGRPILAIYCCRIVPHTNYMGLLKYILRLLKTYVDAEYIVIIFDHEIPANNLPSFSEAKKMYDYIEPTYAKMIDKLLIVIPTPITRSYITFLKQFISVKFNSKIALIEQEDELNLHTDCTTIYIPDDILETFAKNKKPNLNKYAKRRVVNWMETSLKKIESEGMVEPSGVPILIQKCCECIELFGLGIKGIFRISVALSDRKAFMKNSKKDKKFEINDPNLAACLLKMFFRQLDEPIFTYDCWDLAYKIEKLSEDEQKIQLKKFYENLPKINRKSIERFSRCLEKVASNYHENLMNYLNLSTVTGINMMRHRGESLDDQSLENTRVACNFFYIFLITKPYD